MKRIFHFCILLYKIICGYIYKLFLDLGLLRIPSLNYAFKRTPNVVVSLTSYGRRVSSCVVYYTIVSILRQKIQPDRIIIWISEEEWNHNLIPKRIFALRNKGVEIRSCKDYKSYKKLIPALQLCKDDIIITIDDDIIYSKDTISSFLKYHKLFPNQILCYCSSIPIEDHGVPHYYDKWELVDRELSKIVLFPIGYGAILYPPGSLHKDVLDIEKFEALCPNADDIWFWFNSTRINIIKTNIHKNGIDFSFDMLYQHFHKGAALTHMNRMENSNDLQFKKLFEYYNVRLNVDEDKLQNY